MGAYTPLTITPEEFYAIVKQGGPITRKTLEEYGYTRSQIQRASKRWLREGKVFILRGGRMNNDWFYHTKNELPDDLRPIIKHEGRSRKLRKELPPYPKLVLNWMGYTDIAPRDDVGEIYYGE